ncbi:MAG: hypothetical protein PHF86_00845 [Candidatus Nanoarchaeia archaeon]|nr:hypothetical protein [Candidatus Nanoarchaeia archaeon]
MRAKTLNEIQNFERGQDPKKVLDLNGIVPSKKFHEIFKKAKQEWYAYIKELLEGKIISGDINEYKAPYWVPVSKSIKVIQAKYELKDGGGISIFDESDEEFYIKPGGKIYIRE